jgi:ElaB/YqjD/DUF883 family membrane-anchored ribosome-binding protein
MTTSSPAPSANPSDTATPTTAGGAGRMQDAAHETQPVERLAHRLCDHLSDMAHHSRDAVTDAQKLLAQKTHQVSSSAEHYIHCAPFKSVLIAAGVGAAAATLVNWLLRSRNH